MPLMTQEVLKCSLIGTLEAKTPLEWITCVTDECTFCHVSKFEANCSARVLHFTTTKQVQLHAFIHVNNNKTQSCQLVIVFFITFKATAPSLSTLTYFVWLHVFSELFWVCTDCLIHPDDTCCRWCFAPPRFKLSHPNTCMEFCDTM